MIIAIRANKAIAPSDAPRAICMLKAPSPTDPDGAGMHPGLPLFSVVTTTERVGPDTTVRAT
jgi:hypothetical protein